MPMMIELLQRLSKLGLSVIQEDVCGHPWTLSRAVVALENAARRSESDAEKGLCGVPAHVPRLRAYIPIPESPCTLQGTDIPSWHEFGTTIDIHRWPRPPKGTLAGWKPAHGRRFVGFQQPVPALLDLGTKTTARGWRLRINDLAGFTASKSELSVPCSMDEWIEKARPNFLVPVTDAQLMRCARYSEVRVSLIFDCQADAAAAAGTPHSSDHLYGYQWDHRVFLANSGGSHHVAATRYLARRLGRECEIVADLQVYGLNHRAIAQLTDEFRIYAVSQHPSPAGVFHDAMKQVRAPYLWCSMPKPYNHQSQAIFLPRSDKRSMRVADVLSGHDFFDVGNHLAALAEQQGDPWAHANRNGSGSLIDCVGGKRS